MTPCWKTLTTLKKRTISYIEGNLLISAVFSPFKVLVSVMWWQHYIAQDCCNVIENMFSKKSKIVYSVKVSRLEFVSLPIAEWLQSNFYKLLCLKQRIAKRDWKSVMYSALKCLYIFIFICVCLTFSWFLIPIIYVINIRQ